MDTDWFRNRSWNEAIESQFLEKLRRARKKQQYLRIQASTLAFTCPDVALRLLDQYFEMPDDFDHAQAYVDRATALCALERFDEAVGSYEAALAREKEFPNLRTQACIELPYLIAIRGIRESYPRALEVLHAHASQMMFPVDHFRWHATQALIAADLGDTSAARVHGKNALDAAAVERSRFRYHPSVGLVGERYDGVIRKLEEWSDA